MYQSIKTSIFAIDQDIINASKLDGASDFKIFTKIILPLCKMEFIVEYYYHLQDH